LVATSCKERRYVNAISRLVPQCVTLRRQTNMNYSAHSCSPQVQLATAIDVAMARLKRAGPAA
ncbi:MAG: hypothetical protein AAFR23_06895, partial [Pseudomonadota bacterium]